VDCLILWQHAQRSGRKVPRLKYYLLNKAVFKEWHSKHKISYEVLSGLSGFSLGTFYDLLRNPPRATKLERAKLLAETMRIPFEKLFSEKI
jgi:hypothetical protein